MGIINNLNGLMGEYKAMRHTCCFTGHRKIAPEKQKIVAERLNQMIEELILEGYCYFVAGGAIGFDTMAEKCVLSLKEKYPHIKLILILPCVTQASSWLEEDKQTYEDMKQRADKIVYVSQVYTRNCMFQRNRSLVDHSNICVAYLMRNKGGTAYTVDYARRKGIKVINLAQ